MSQTDVLVELIRHATAGNQSYFIFYPFARVLIQQYKLNRLADIC